MTRETLRSIALVLGPLVLLAAAFGACFERKTEEVPVGFSREALTNPYLALERLLANMGREVVSLDGLGDLVALPPANATLVLPIPRDTLSSERSQSLLDWVAEGGHLLVVTHSIWDEDDRRPDPLLDRFGLQQHGSSLPDEDEDGDADPDAQAEVVPEAELDSEPKPVDGEPVPPSPQDLDSLARIFGAFSGAPLEWDVAEAAWPGRAAPLQLRFDPRYHWIDSEERASWSAAGPEGVHALTLAHGAGSLTALTDDWLLRNDRLGDADHAELLVRLAGLNGRDGPVWVVVSARWPGLWSQATKYAAPVLTSLALLLAAWLWRQSRRFGPLAPDALPERRRWIEHLDAAGRYYWRQDRGLALLRATRERVMRDLTRRRPQLAGLAPLQRDQRIAEHAGLRLAEVQRAFAQGPARPEEFSATIANLERIRASL